MPPSHSDNKDASPPTMPQQPSGEREVLHAKFSCAAAALTDLFKESTNAYEAGYRDALLYMHRYVLLASTRPALATSPREANHDASESRHADSHDSARAAQHPPGNVWPAAPALSPHSVLPSERTLRFIQATLRRRRERVAVERGTRERRRRSRSADLPFAAECAGATSSDSDAEQDINSLTASSVTPSLHGAQNPPETEEHANATTTTTTNTNTNATCTVAVGQVGPCRGRDGPRRDVGQTDAEEATGSAGEPPRQVRRCFPPLPAARWM